MHDSARSSSCSAPLQSFTANLIQSCPVTSVANRGSCAQWTFWGCLVYVSSKVTYKFFASYLASLRRLARGICVSGSPCLNGANSCMPPAFLLMPSSRALDQLPEAAIGWPPPAEMEQYSAILHQRNPLLEHCFAFCDGTSVACYCEEDPILQNGYYNGWKGQAVVSSVFLWTPDGKIRWAAINYPGSFHDCNVAQQLYRILQCPRLCPDQFKIIGDSAFQRKPWHARY